MTFEVDDALGLLLLLAAFMLGALTYSALLARAFSINLMALELLGCWLAYDENERAVIMCNCDAVHPFE